MNQLEEVQSQPEKNSTKETRDVEYDHLMSDTKS